MMLLSSVSHIGEVRGITALFRREKVISEAGEVVELPIVSGNALRGILRDCGARYLCRLLGVGHDGVRLSMRAFYLLFSGGALTDSGGSINVERLRELRELVPFISVFGGAIGNAILPGRLIIGKVVPIATETAHLLSEIFYGIPATSVWDMTQNEPYTRFDDAKNPFLDSYHTEQDEDASPQQMRYYIETLAAGTPLAWQFHLEGVTRIELESFASAMMEWGRRPQIGGKGAIGHGSVALEFLAWRPEDLPICAETQFPIPAPNEYNSFVAANRGQILEVLNGL